MSRRIWLTWEVQRRNRTMSTMLNADLHEIIVKGSRLKRYPLQVIKTLKVILKSKSRVIFVQNPSLLLSALCVFSCKFSNATVVVDAHNAGIFPLEGQSKMLNKVAALVNSLADKVIVSNSALVEFVEKDADQIYAIPDPIPDIKAKSAYPLDNDKFNLVFVCSWADDEPYEEVLRLSENIAERVHIYITGNSRGKEKSFCGVLPKNVTLTGFISEDDYENLLQSCNAVMVLTKRDNCLVCGAYEGVALEKPMLLSKTDALIHQFSKGCIYTDNTEKDIESSILELLDGYEDLLFGIKELKVENQNKFNKTLSEFDSQLPV